MRRKFYTILRSGEKSLIIVAENTRMLALEEAGSKPPFYMVDSYPYFIDVIKLLGVDRPVMSLIGHEEMLMAGHYTIADEAAQHVQTILEHQPRGPYMVGGCSASGIVAYEIAQQMSTLGHEVSLLVLFDTPNPYYMREYSALHMSLNSYRDDLSRLRVHEIPSWAAMKIKALVTKKTGWLQKASLEANGAQAQLGPSERRIELARKYRPTPYSGRVLLFKRHRELTGRYLDRWFGWGKAVSGDIEICEVDALDHLEIFKSEIDRTVVAQALRDNFSEADGSSYNLNSFGQEERTG
jgi:thioesterase domain-containing protein